MADDVIPMPEQAEIFLDLPGVFQAGFHQGVAGTYLMDDEAGRGRHAAVPAQFGIAHYGSASDITDVIPVQIEAQAVQKS